MSRPSAAQRSTSGTKPKSKGSGRWDQKRAAAVYVVTNSQRAASHKASAIRQRVGDLLTQIEEEFAHTYASHERITVPIAEIRLLLSIPRPACYDSKGDVNL